MKPYGHTHKSGPDEGCPCGHCYRSNEDVPHAAAKPVYRRNQRKRARQEAAQQLETAISETP